MFAFLNALILPVFILLCLAAFLQHYTCVISSPLLHVAYGSFIFVWLSFLNFMSLTSLLDNSLEGYNIKRYETICNKVPPSASRHSVAFYQGQSVCCVYHSGALFRNWWFCDLGQGWKPGCSESLWGKHSHRDEMCCIRRILLSLCKASLQCPSRTLQISEKQSKLRLRKAGKCRRKESQWSFVPGVVSTAVGSQAVDP